MFAKISHKFLYSSTFALVAAACALLTTATANATPLPVNSAIPSAPAPGLAGGGVLVANSGPVPFTAPTFTGTLQSEVFLNDPANPFGPGDATFTYLFADTGSGDGIGRMTIDGFGFPGLLTDASYQAPTLGVLPSSFDRSAGLGNTIGVTFQAAPLGFGVVHPGSASALLVIHTNTPLFNPSVASFIDGSVAGGVPTFAPLASPEPASLTLFGLGAAAILARRKKA